MIAIAKLGAVYVPSLYATAIDPHSLLEVVTGARVPACRSRSKAIARRPQGFSFPRRQPDPAGRALIFDRLSIEIARGCTEGCRFY